MLPKAPRILYFIGGALPTDEQQRDAMRYGPNCVIRNGRYADADGAPERCDGVAGMVPEPYKNLPDGAAVYKAYLDKTNALTIAVSATPAAPVAPAAPLAPPAAPVAPVAPAAPAAPDSGWGQQPPPPPPVS